MRVDLKPVLLALRTHWVRREHYGPRFDKWIFLAKCFQFVENGSVSNRLQLDDFTIPKGFTYLFLVVPRATNVFFLNSLLS